MMGMLQDFATGGSHPPVPGVENTDNMDPVRPKNIRKLKA